MAASPASAASWNCEASAVRAAVLGQQLAEPIVANKGQTLCKVATGVGSALPAPLGVSTLAASTGVTGDTPANQVVTATGGLVDLGLRLIDLPIKLPVDEVIDAVPPVNLSGLGVPAGLSVDIRPALRSAIGGLPNTDLLRVRSAVAYASGSCVGGAGGVPKLEGFSRVAGVSLFGKELGVDQVVNQALEITSGRSFDPSTLDVSKIQLPDGIAPGLLPLVQAAIQPALDALPNIQLPATLAQVTLTPGTQERSGGSLVQRALTLTVAVAGQRLADAVIGEAKVAQDEVVCGTPDTVAAAALQCTTRRLTLIDVYERAGRVQLIGAADKRYIGERVRIFFPHQRRYVASAIVKKNGTFKTTAALPARNLRATNLARYQARVGRARSLRLKLERRMVVRSVRVSGNKVRISGRVTMPLAAPTRAITIKRRVSCSKLATVATVRPKSDGTFSVTVKAPPKSQAAVYRLETRVRKTETNPKTFPTFTLPRFVDLGA